MARKGNALSLRIAVAEVIARKSALTVDFFNCYSWRQMSKVHLLHQGPKFFQALVHPSEGVSHREGGDCDSDEKSRLLPLGSCSDKKSCLQILRGITGICRCDA